MCELAQADGARHARAAFQGVQRALQRIGRAAIGAIRAPGGETGAQLRRQLFGLLDEDRQQRVVEVVAHHALFLRPRRHQQPAAHVLHGSERRNRRRRRLVAPDYVQHLRERRDCLPHRLPVGRADRTLGERHPLL